MSNNLNFIDTQTIEQFKKENSVKEIQVRQNPVSGKLFATYGAKTATISNKGIPTHPMISLVNETLDRMPTAEERMYIGKSVKIDGKTVSHPDAHGFFYLIHEEGQGGAPVLAKF